MTCVIIILNKATESKKFSTQLFKLAILWRYVMTTQTSLVAVQVRLRQWAEQIRDCQNRPEGMDVETWCSQNHITKSNYYYRLRRVCKAYLDQIPGTEIPAFVELPALDTAASKNTVSDISAAASPIIRISNAKGISAEIFPGIPPEMLRCTIEAFNHAE